MLRSPASRLPRPAGWTRRRKLAVTGGSTALVVMVLAVGYILLARPFARARPDLVPYKVHYDSLALTIVERGALEAANNADVYCRVKAGSKNSTVATTIKWVIDDGSSVKKGDLLVELDDSGLQEQLKSQKITLDTDQGNMVQAEEAFKITVAQNESDIKSAEIDWELAKIDLRKYEEGDFPQSLKDVDGRIASAESDLEMQRERAAWAQRMMKKGYYTVSQVQGEQSKLESLDFALRKVKEEKRVLVDPEYGLKKRTETDYASKAALKQRVLNQIKAQAVAKEIQARTDRDVKKSLYLQALSQYHDIEAEIKKCKIYAPQDGMVVYFIPEQARGGGGSQQSIVAQGEPVREGQKLMQIPDLKHMLVSTKVHEALVSRVHAGQKATVRVDSFAERILPGKVDTVATISAQQDWLSADVKVYNCKVAIGDQIDGLKPGMSAEVTITVGDMLDHVLTIPLQAIVGSVEMGKHRKCFVQLPDGQTDERDIEVGMSNDKMAEIKSGVQEGEVVVLNPRVLLGEKSKLRTTTPSAAIEETGGPANQGGPAKDGAKKRERNGTSQKGGPQAGAGAGGRSGQGKEASDPERQKARQEMTERFRKATPEERKSMLEKMPTEFRDRVKQGLKAQGMEVAD